MASTETIKQREAYKLSQLLKSSQEANRQLGLALVHSTNATAQVKKCIEQEMGYACFSGLEALNATQVFQGRGSDAGVGQFLNVLDQMPINQRYQRCIRQAFMEMAIWAEGVHLEKNVNFLIDISPVSSVILLKEAIWVGHLTSPLVSLEYFNSLAHDRELIKMAFKKLIKSRSNTYPEVLYDLSLLDIIKKTNSPLQYAVYPTADPEMVTFFLKAIISPSKTSLLQ